MSLRKTNPNVLAVARGERPADLLVRGGVIFVPGTREWIETDLAIVDGMIAGWGTRDALEVLDVSGAALTAGFVDAHMHLESTKLWVDEFVRAVLPRGTTAVAADPHELANVFGVRGIAALAAAASRLPFTFGICASSCVPASAFESPGAELHARDVKALIEEYDAIGVAEVMDFPAVIAGDQEVLDKIAAAGHRRVDGHAPGLTGHQLDAYLAAGIESDHECTVLEEAEEKRRKGMWVFIRQGSASQNLRDLIGTVLEHGTDRVALCSDDREPDTILREGHLDDCVRLAVACGVPIEDALVLASANPADYHHFDHLGWLAPGYQADILCFDELSTVSPRLVLQAGHLVARDGAVLHGAVPHAPAPAWMRASVHFDAPPSREALTLDPPPSGRARVLGVASGTLTTKSLVLDVTDPQTRVSRIAVAERHRLTGRIGLGYVHGFDLARGAIASTVAHDAHNAMVVGAIGEEGPEEMAVALARLAELGGGQVAVLNGTVLAEVALPIAGLMSDATVGVVADQVHHLGAVTAKALGVRLAAPFMQLSFLGLSVLPALRITDLGLVDVERFALTDVALEL